VNRALLQWTEIQASVCLVGGALLMGQAAFLLLDEDSTWSGYGYPLLVAALLAIVCAVGPWVWPAAPLAWRRAVGWSAWILGTVVSLLAMFPLEYEAFGGAQLVLLGLVLSEMNGRPSTLRWFYVSLGTVVLAVIAYYGLVDLRPVAD
jgi:hypothetical protein